MSYGPPRNSDPGPRPPQGREDQFLDLALQASSDARLSRGIMSVMVGLPTAILAYQSYNASLIYYGLSCMAIGWLSGWAVAFRTRLPDRGAKP